MPRPPHDTRGAHAAFPGGELSSFERSVATVRISDHFSTVVSGENDDSVIQLTHLLELREHQANVVIHLLHAGFVDAPVLTAWLTDHCHVFIRQHGRNMHASRVVPDKE